MISGARIWVSCRAQWNKDLGAKQKVRVLLGARFRWQIGGSGTEIWGGK